MNRQMFTPSAPKLSGLMIGLCLGLTATLLSQPTRAAGNPAPAIQANGVYLYGEAAEADQVGKGYVVFSQKNGRVVGAVYHPSSEFSCFSGAIADDQLQVIPSEMGTEDASNQNMSLTNLYQIKTLTDISQNALKVCEQEIAQNEVQKLGAK
jgi:hypothetical protein